MKEHFVIQLLHKHYTGELDGQEQDMLLNWLKDSPDNKVFSEEIKQIWELSGNYKPPAATFEPNVDQAFDKFRAKMHEVSTPIINTENDKEKPLVKTRSLNPIYWLSGAAAMIIAVAGLWLVNNSSNDSAISLQTIADQQEHLQLADNTELWINEKSITSYNISSNERNLNLEGEAYFDVAKSDVPFVITTPNATVTVKGTSFNVDATETVTVVEVKNGLVELKPLNSTKSIMLSENMTGSYNSETMKLERKQTKTYNGNSWLTGGFAFEDATLEEVFDKLGDHYNVKFQVKNTDLYKCVFTSPVYQDNGLEEVLQIMQLIYGFEYEFETEEKNKVIIAQGGC